MPNHKNISFHITQNKGKACSQGNGAGNNQFSVKQKRSDQSSGEGAGKKPEYDICN